MRLEPLRPDRRGLWLGTVDRPHGAGGGEPGRDRADGADGSGGRGHGAADADVDAVADADAGAAVVVADADADLGAVDGRGGGDGMMPEDGTDDGDTDPATPAR